MYQSVCDANYLLIVICIFIVHSEIGIIVMHRCLYTCSNFQETNARTCTCTYYIPTLYMYCVYIRHIKKV